jgi:hypothetical protein
LDCVAETVIARLPNPSRTAIFSGADRVHGLLSTQTMLKRIGFVSGLVIALGVTVGGSQNSSALANYRVPAGTVLQARLRTPLGSASSRVDDQVDAILLEPVNGDGVELIPVGSAIHGRVVDVTPASQRELRGRLSLAFFVVQHAQTGSRAAIVSRPIKFEASEPEEPVTKGRRQKKYPVDVQTSPAQLVSVTLAEPLTVFLPK